jgi:SAM-dependent methyltransferase
MRIISQFREWRHSVYGFNIYNRRKWVAEHASRLPAGTRVLDVGAGAGQYRPLFAICAYKAHDFGQELQTIGHYTPLDYQSDILAIPVPDESFDVILCTEVLEHVPEPIKAVVEMARVLRPGGLMLLSAPLGCLLHQEPHIYYGGYTPYWYRRFLGAAGCDVISIDANQGFFSLFADYSQWFSNLIRPGETRREPWYHRIFLAMLWLASRPAGRMLGPLGRWLDRRGFGGVGTVGYHVVAVRRGGAPLIHAREPGP